MSWQRDAAPASCCAASGCRSRGDATNAALTGGFQWAFWVCGAIALLAPATTALILRRKRASEIDGAVPALEVGGVN